MQERYISFYEGVVKKIKFSDDVVRYIVDTNHSIERFSQRYNDDDKVKAEIYKIIIRGIGIILNKYNDKRSLGYEYVIRSKSTGIAVVISWRPSNYDFGVDKEREKVNNAVIVTIFPPKEVHRVRPTDVRILVEKQYPKSVFIEV